MSDGLRWGFVLVGLALLFGSLMGSGMLLWEWRFRGITAASVAQYDLRPFIFASPVVQVWFARLVPLGWKITGVAGLVFFLMGSFRPRAGRLTIVGFVSMCVLALLMTVASGHTFLRHGAVPVASLPGFERLARVSFPPNAELIEARYEGGMDPSYMAKVAMPPAAVEGFAKSAIMSKMSGQGPKPAPIRLSRTERLEMYVPESTGFADWHPEKAKRFLAASTTSVSYQPQIQMIADQDDPNRSIVYLTIRYT